MKNAILAVLVFVALGLYGCERERAAELRGRIAHLEQEKSRVDTVYRTLSKTQVKVRLRTDSLLVTDTLWRSDTVRVLIAAERKACDAVIHTCEQRVAIRDTIITALRSRSSFKIGLPWGVGGVVIGAVGGILAGVAISK